MHTTYDAMCSAIRCLYPPRRCYQATPDELSADEGLKAIHESLSDDLQLYGALVTHGISPRKLPWAQELVKKFPTLGELRLISWRRLMRVVDVGAADASAGGGGVGGGGSNHAEDDGDSEDEHDEVRGERTERNRGERPAGSGH